jgi:hypothetical protein
MAGLLMFGTEEVIHAIFISAGAGQRIKATFELGEVWLLHMQLEIDSIIHLMDRDDKK